MEFRILGPLEVTERNRQIALSGGKPRALLAILLLHRNEVVPSERLIEELWGDSPPATAAKNVQLYVSMLRKALRNGDEQVAAEDPLSTRAGGYLLRVDDGELDAQCFERLLGDGRAALKAGTAEEAAETLRGALALWRGRALVDFSYEPFAQQESARLEELRVGALEARVDADLALGRHAELVPELEALLAEHPLRERLRAQLMLALYRSDRQAEALDVYREGRRRLVEELGLEPGPALQRLEREILVHSSEIAVPETATSRSRGLPSPPNRTIGRDREVGATALLLREGAVRLVTLTGPGGTGKTRLALEVARVVEADFAHGAQLVPLAGVQRAGEVPAALVTALGIVPMSTESAGDAAQRVLAAKHLLLVLDNCEHLLDAAGFIGDLLARCPAVTVLATSRRPLALQAEHRFPVPPLELPPHGTPDDPALLLRAGAVALFVERARAHDPAFAPTSANGAAIVDICRRVDGLPLAIELAAARCGLLSPPEIAQRLDVALDAPGAGARDAPARQQTLRATIDWSHALLDDAEKACFARLAVFAGGATLEAAEAVTGAGLGVLDALVTQSLLARVDRGQAPTRLVMLETIRSYATELLARTPDHDEVRERHYRYHLALAERHGSERALWGPHQAQHLAALDAETDNLDAALHWATRQRDGQLAIALVVALGQYWLLRSRYAYAVERTDEALAGAGGAPELRARALLLQDWLMWPLGRGGDREAIVDEAAALAWEAGDAALISRAYRSRAHVVLLTARLEEASALAEQAVDWALKSGDDWEVALALCEHANSAPTMPALLARVERAERRLSEVGNVHKLCSLLSSAGYGAVWEGCDREAISFLERAEAIAGELDEPHASMMISGNLGLAALFLGDLERARTAFRKELRLCGELATLPVAHEALRGLAAIAVAEDDDARAALLLGAATAHRYDDPEDAVDERLRTNFFEPARARAHKDVWAESFDRGAGLSFDDAIAHGLAERSPEKLVRTAL